MKDERNIKENERERTEPAITPLGMPPEPPVRDREGDIIHTAPELAVGEGDVRTAEMGQIVAGTSLWKDAWRRLLRNKLAVFGMIVVGFMILATLFGPLIIRKTTGYEYFTVPEDSDLIKSLPPFRNPDNSFSWTHPMGTDNTGRDILARVLIGGRISLMVGIISTLVSLLIGITYGATAGYLGGRVDNVMMRIVDVLYALPYMMIVIVLLAFFGSGKLFGNVGGSSALGQLILLFLALGAVSWLTMARIVRGQVISLKNQE
ncbi:MAG TPA: ABC transporter permease, partial [Pyrinomonadaceae bacterium]|nr:ABC transporter permease [Pyrinomonadaceae bacterium]